MKTNPTRTVLALVLLAILLYTPIFSHLDKLPLRQWDEARNAHNALEMYQNGLSIVTTFGGQPEMWNTKPPMLIWSQALWMKLLGPGELSVRLPSALATLFSCILFAWFGFKSQSKLLVGGLASLILVSSSGYMLEHGSRHGDFDAMLSFFTTAYLLLFFLFLKEGRRLFLYLFFIALGLAGLTKGVSAFIFLPTLLLFSLYKRRTLQLLQSRDFYLGLGISLAMLCAYYLGREQLNPGYLQAVWDNELGGRYAGILDGHTHEWNWYLLEMINGRYAYWFPLLLVSWIYLLWSGKSSLRDFGIYSLSASMVFLVVISTANTKLSWYDIPLYPIFALTIGLSLSDVIGRWMRGTELAPGLRNLSAALALVVLFLIPYSSIFVKTNTPREQADQVEFYRMGEYLQKVVRGKFPVEDATVLHHGTYSAHLSFYTRILNERGHGMRVHTSELEKLTTGDRLIIYQNIPKNYLAERFQIERQQLYNNIELWVLGEEI